MRMSRTLFLACSLFASAASAQGAVPTSINFSARLTDSGAPVSAQRNFVFKLFVTPAGGSELWAETRNMLQVTNGTLNVDLGASTPLTETLLDGRALWLEITVDGTVLTPRMQLNSVPYALRSTVANRVGALTETDLQRRVANSCPAGSAIRVINADGTVTCQASAISDGGTSSGITSITAGGGLTGGGATGDVNLGIDFGGSGSANTVSRSDHTHTTFLPRGVMLSCSTNERVRSIDGTTGNVTCAPDTNSGGTVTSVTAGTGLTGGAITTTGTIGLAATVQNWTNQPSCPAGSALRTVTAAGVGTCESMPPPLTPATNGGLVIGGGSIGLVSTGCPNNATMRFNGTAWVCALDVASVTAGSGSGIVATNSGGNVALALATTVPNFTQTPTCPAGAVLRGVGLNGAPNCVTPQAADAIFNLTVQGASGSFAALWVNCFGSSCNIAVPGSYAFGSNPSAQTVSVVRNSAGNYNVPIPWMNQGVPQVTTYSGGGHLSCRVGGWGNFPVNVNVLCYDTSP